MRIAKLAAAAVLGLAASALALGGTAQAHHNEVSVDINADGCFVKGTTDWTQKDHKAAGAVLVLRVDGEVAVTPVGDPFEYMMDKGTTTVEWRVWGAGERDYDSPALTDLPALLAHLDAGGDVLDADAPGVAWHQLELTGCGPDPAPLPMVEFEDTCDGTLVALANDAEATADVEFTLDPALDLDLPVTLEPGHEPEPLLVPSDVGEITVTAGGEVWTHVWADPGDCDEPGTDPTTDPVATGGDGGGDESLPVTGAALPLLVGGAVLLLATGGGLFLAARRRRVTFTA